MPIQRRLNRRPDVGRPVRRALLPMLDCLESRQHMAADLYIHSTRIDVSTPSDPVVGNGTITIQYTIANKGNTAAQWSDVGVYQSDTATLNASDTKLTTVNGASLAAGASRNGIVTVSVSLRDFDLDDNAGFVTLRADPINAVLESNETNNHSQGVGTDSALFKPEGDVEAYTGIDPRLLPINGTLNAKLGDELIGDRDIDAYEVICTTGKFYEADVDTDAFGPDTVVRVYDWNRNLIASNDDAGYSGGGTRAADPYLQWTATSGAGRYFVVVSAKANANADPTKLEGRVAGGTGNYTIVAREAKWSWVKVQTTGTATEGAAANQPVTLTVTRSADGWIDRPLQVKWETYGTATLPNDLNLPADGIIIPAGQTSVTLALTPAQDHVAEPLEYVVVNLLGDARYYREAASSSAAVYIQDDPVTAPPAIKSVRYDANGPISPWRPGLVVDFDRNIGQMKHGDLWLENLTTKQRVPVATSTQMLGRADRFAFLWLYASTTPALPDGAYRLHFLAGSYTSETGVAGGELTADFRVLAGDADGNGTVDFSDLLTLAKNFNQTGKTFAQGNFNYSHDNGDSKVNFDDLLVLARNFNKSITTPTTGVSAAAAIAAPVPCSPLYLPTRATTGRLRATGTFAQTAAIV